MRALTVVLALSAFPRIAQAQDAQPPADAPGPAPAEATPAKTNSPQQTAPDPRPSVGPERPDATKVLATEPEVYPSGRFEFGSYGRVRMASDLRGGTGRESNIVAHGSRIDEESYAEIELRREDAFAKGLRTKIVTTLALLPPFFHFTGKEMQSIALRNLFAQGTIDDTYTLWVGSRMYRGDDIYLLNWWPLDNQNTVGGGGSAKIHALGNTTVAGHVGMQRLDNPYQYQRIDVVRPFAADAVSIVKLDRPRLIETLKVTHLVGRGQGEPGFKVILYGEAHQLAAGVAQDPATKNDKSLPEDQGWLAGSELAYWTGQRDTFIQLFLRHARGVAAYDPLAVPTTFANDRTTTGTTETLVALGGNYEYGMFGCLLGSYVRFFRDGSASPSSAQKFDEGTVAVRPQLYFGEHWGLAVDGSYQARRYALLDPTTNEPLTASITKLGVMPYFSPAGRGSYKRPQLRLLYVASAKNQGVRSLFPAEDAFAQRAVEHFLGLGAEWWFNSSSYP